MNNPLLRTLALALVLGGCTTGTSPDAGPDAEIDAGPADAAPDAPVRTCDEPGSTVGDACSSTVQCNDGCFCNGIELCEEGTCVAGTTPCDDEAECTVDTCNEDTRRCAYAPDHASCADDDLCNGEERCVLGVGCRSGLRLSCNAGSVCQIGRCDPTEGCTFELRDLDADGFADHRCGGDDCFDDPADGSTVYPGAEEVCGNERDDNCNGLVDYREPGCLGTNDTCDDAEVLPGSGVFVRTTRGLTSNYPLGCRATGTDAVFRFTLTTAQDVEARIAADSGSASVALRTAAGCASGPDTYCSATDVLARDLAPGDYVLIVKTTVPTAYTLSLTFLDATPVLPVDVCDSEAFEINASGSFNGFFSDINDDYQISCRTTSSTSYPDAAYRLVLTEESDIRLTARTTASTSTTTYLSLMRDCTAAESALACVQGSSAVIDRLSVPAGTYYVLIESSRNTASTWSLDVDIQPAMPRTNGDACSTEVDITDTTATIPLSGLVHDYGTSCGGTTSSARDANLFFTLTAVSDVLLTTNVGAVHQVAVSSACGDRTTETFCTSGTPGVSRRFLRLDPGTYHVTVATTLSSGDLVASAEVLPATFPPGNDTCVSPSPLSDGVPFSADLLAAGDAVASCATSGSPDTVHSLVLTERRNVTAVARRTGGITEPLYLGLRTACEDASSDLTCTSGSPALLNRTLDPGTYYFVVESVASFVGPYTLTVYLAAP